jgi:hypothetical protein
VVARKAPILRLDWVPMRRHPVPNFYRGGIVRVWGLGTSISREGGSLALILLRDSTNSTLIDVLWNRCPFVTVSSNLRVEV